MYMKIYVIDKIYAYIDTYMHTYIDIYAHPSLRGECGCGPSSYAIAMHLSSLYPSTTTGTQLSY